MAFTYVRASPQISEAVAREAVAAVGSTLEEVLHKQTVMEQLLESRYGYREDTPRRTSQLRTVHCRAKCDTAVQVPLPGADAGLHGHVPRYGSEVSA